MIVLRLNTPMIIKKKTKDTMRKNVPRSPVIMMTHLLCAQEKPRTRWTESAPIDASDMMTKFYHGLDHHAVAD